MLLFDEVAAERLTMADLLTGLSVSRLRTSGLCAGWTGARTVRSAAHGDGRARRALAQLCGEGLARFSPEA